MHLPTRYYTGIHFPEDVRFEIYLSLRTRDLLNQITLSRRIGSESIHAKVYSSIIDNVKVAIKILKNASQFDSPLDCQTSFDNEFKINEYIFQHDDTFNYFLYMINGLMCRDSAYIIMELAVSDIKQRLLYTDYTINDLNRVVDETLISLRKLAELRIYHGDLHIGNVFMVMRDKEIKAVIGDFGESSFTDSPTASFSDLSYFISSFREHIDQYPQFRNKLDQFRKDFGKMTYGLEQESEEMFDPEIDNENGLVIQINTSFIDKAIQLWQLL